jgi:hypothetical protein
MGRQVGLIKVSGNIGGVSFYKSNGQDLARVANGPSKDKIQNDNNFVRTRENNSEFGGSATAGKSLRLSLATSISTMGDKRITSRLTALFKDICSRSTGTRGQRPITVSTNRTLLENLEFNDKQGFASVFNAPFTFTNNTGRTQGTITIAAFAPQTFIHAPTGATHFRLVASIGVLSDFVYNTSTQKFEATDPTLDKLGAVTYGTITALNSATPVTFSLVVALGGTPTMTATSNVLQCLGIEFYQRVGTVDYLLAQSNCMKVVKVF